MQAENIEGCTRVMGANQAEFHGLAIRDEVQTFDFGDGSGRKFEANSMTSRWRPTPEELTCLLNGGFVYLRVLGSTHPGVMVWAGK